MIPIASYLWLSGRCSACRGEIPTSYPLVEAVTAGSLLGAYYLSGWSVDFLGDAVLIALVVTAAEIDRRHGIVPNALLGVGALLAILLSSVGGTVVASGTAAVGAAGVLWVLRHVGNWLFGGAGFGMGDVKLVAVMGLFLGWEVLWVCYLAVLVGGTVGLVGLATQQYDRGATLPFAPFLAIGTGLALFCIPGTWIWTTLIR